jgi:hypothetical protein
MVCYGILPSNLVFLTEPMTPAFVFPMCFVKVFSNFWAIIIGANSGLLLTHAMPDLSSDTLIGQARKMNS